jgi:glycosyltransferase involved in cell wall biosynthesis
MPDVAEKAKSSGVELTFNVIAPFITQGSLEYSQELLDEVTRICHSLGGRVYFHCNGTDGREPFGNTENWKVASIGAATLILDQVTREDYDFNITYGFDAPYHGVAQLVLDQLSFSDREKPVIVWVPHSTGLVHETPNIPHNAERYELEKRAVDYSTKHDQAFLGFISQFMKSHLVEDFSASEEKLVPLINGITDQTLNAYSQDTVEHVLSKYGVDPESKIIYATGRAEKYKGFDVLIEGFASTQHLHDAELVLVISTKYTYTASFDEIARQFYSLNVRGKIIEGFINQKEMMAIIQSQNTIAAVVPSRREPFGLLPVEFRVWAHDLGPVLIASNVGGLSEQIEHGVDGYLFDADDPLALGKQIVKAVHADDKTRVEFTARGKKKVSKQYAYPDNIFQSLMMLLERTDGSA